MRASAAQRVFVKQLPVAANNLPLMMYGTAWKAERTAVCVAEAMRHGFRAIDTACQPKHYNEVGVGQGWTTAAKELGLKREDVFLQTKFTALAGQDLKQPLPYKEDAPLTQQVKQSLATSLSNLQTTYIDSVVLHSPMSTFADTLTVWQELESAVDTGVVRRLGISNCYDVELFTTLCERARITPSFLQNRFYSESGFDTELRRYCAEHDIFYQSFWTLSAKRHALASQQLMAMATSMQLTPQQLMYAYVRSLNIIPLNGTTDPTHMREDVDIVTRCGVSGRDDVFVKTSAGDQMRRTFASLVTGREDDDVEEGLTD
jgi:diketogulonate reductase-like aldo/keto reductase